MFLFGSNLIKSLFPDFREPRDLDYVTNNAELLDSVDRKKIDAQYIPCSPNREMTANEIYTVKVSHAIYNINWQKHMSDIRFLQIKGCVLDREFLSELRDYWRTVHTDPKHSRFNFSSKEDIFEDTVVRKVHHDKLHLLFNDELMFTYFCDGYIPNEKKWTTLSSETKDIICFEEAYVISLERFYDRLQQNTAYHQAQNLLVTKLHPLFIADYVIENWNKFYKPERNYYEIYEGRSPK